MAHYLQASQSSPSLKATGHNKLRGGFRYTLFIRTLGSSFSLAFLIFFCKISASCVSYLSLIFVIKFPVPSKERTLYVLDKIIDASIQNVALIPAVCSAAKEKYLI